MVGQPSRVPGYDQGYAQAPGMPRPTQINPMGRPTAVVGGPAYFTPEGYNAPPQPTQAFMPTDRAPDPIGQQFMRQMQSPMGQQYQQQYEAIQAPMREAEMAQRAEQQAAQDVRFQEMMDRIAQLEGQVATPTEPIAPMPGDVDPYIPGGTFPGIPDFIRDIDFSGLPDLSGIDFSESDLGALGPIINQYSDRMEMGEPEPIDSFIQEAMINQAPALAPTLAPEPAQAMAAQRMPEPNSFFPDAMTNIDMGMRKIPKISSPFGLPLPTEFGMSQIGQAPMMTELPMNLSNMDVNQIGQAPMMTELPMNLSNMDVNQIGQAPMMPLLPNFYDTMEPQKLDSLSQGVRNFSPSISSAIQPSQMMRAPLPLQSQLSNSFLEDDLKERAKRLQMSPSLNLR
jgi:hypothetical protein